MGGFGSGTYYRWRARDTTDGHHRLDVRTLHRAGVLSPGRSDVWCWYRDGQVVASVALAVHGERRADTVGVAYTAGTSPRPIAVAVQVTWTPCHYGGHRPWFYCPLCGARVAVLYVSRSLRCRTCAGLVYESQRESDMTRYMRKARRVRVRLGGHALDDDVPPRPKGMHGATYARLCDQLLEAEAGADLALLDRFGLSWGS